MPSDGANIEITEIDRAEIAVEPFSWEFAVAQREQIDRYFARRQARVDPGSGMAVCSCSAATRFAIGYCKAPCFETDYASFLAWRDWGFPDPSVFNVFGSAVLQAADGAFLLGEMDSSTASAGSNYFPSGTPDLDDISADATLDLAGSVSRELLEETGLEITGLDVRPGWTMVHDRGFVNLMKLVRAPQNAEELRGQIMRHLASSGAAGILRYPHCARTRRCRPPHAGISGGLFGGIWRRGAG